MEQLLEGLKVAASADHSATHPVTATLSGGVTVTARYVVGAADVRGLPDTSINISLGPTDFLLGFPMNQGQDARLVGVVPGELHVASDAVDAAHVHSAVGAQGMNTGLQDAHNLACNLADVLQGRADDSYLDRYDAERRPVAQHIIDFTERVRAAGAARPAGIRLRVADAHPLPHASCDGSGCSGSP